MQDLTPQYFVHLHCLVPGGALGSEGEWKRSRGNYLFPVKALSRHFRGKMVSALRASAEAGELSRVTRPGEVGRLLDELMARDWVIYTKSCLNHTETVVEYLGRYTHRIAISNPRILAVDETGVSFRYKDYRDGDRHKTMHLDGSEFVRRYLLHILPKGLMRVRHYGFLANRCRAAKLAQIREVLEQDEVKTESTVRHGSEEGYPCPVCKTGRLRLIATLPARPKWKAMAPRR